MTILSYFSQLTDAAFCWYLIALPPPTSSKSTAAIAADNGGVELQENPTHSPFITEARDQEEGKHTNSSVSTKTDETTTWLYHLRHNQRLYDFAVLTSIVYPLQHNTTENATASIYTENQVRWKQRWVIFCHICSSIQVILTIFATIGAMIAATRKGFAVEIVLIMSALSQCIPVIAIMPAIFLLKNSIDKSLCKSIGRSIDSSLTSQTSTPVCSENELTRLNAVMIESIINQALSICKLILVPLLLAPLLWGFVQIIVNAIILKGVVVSYIIPILIAAWTMIPPTAMLIGILTFLVMDQRYSYYMLLEMRQKALSNEVIDTVYLSIGKRLEERDANSPLNFMVGVAIVIILLCSITIIYYNTSVGDSVSIHASSTILLTYFASRGVTVLLVALYYMKDVNDMADQLLYQVERRMSTEIIDEKMRLRRLELLAMMKHYRIGSTVFYQRPSTTQLVVQLASLSLAILSAFGKLIFNAIS